MWAFFSPSYPIQSTSFPFCGSTSILFITCSLLCSFFLYIFIIPPAPIFLDHYLFRERKVLFSIFSGLVSFSILFACLVCFLVLFDSPDFTCLQSAVLLFSRIPGFLRFLQPLILLLLLSIGYVFFCLLPMKYMFGFFFQNSMSLFILSKAQIT